MGPSCGTSWIRSIERMWSSVSIEGESPPWRQKICGRPSQHRSGRKRKQGDRTDLVVDERGQGEVVEQVGEELPDVGVAVLAQALVVEAVHLRDLPTLVVPAQDRHAVAVAHLERDEERDCLDRVVPSVDVVAHEEVVRVGRVAADSEELREVVLLGLALASASCPLKVQHRRLMILRVRSRQSPDSASLPHKQERRLTNCPWMSPQTVTGHLTGCTFDSLTRISRACRSREGVMRGQSRRAGPGGSARARIDDAGLKVGRKRSRSPVSSTSGRSFLVQARSRASSALPASQPDRAGGGQTLSHNRLTSSSVSCLQSERWAIPACGR